MITIVTGFNNTGKTQWVADEIAEKYSIFCKLLWDQQDGYVHRINSSNMEDPDDNNHLQETPVFYNPEKNDEYSKCKFEFLRHDPKVIFCNYPENGLHPSLQTELAQKFVDLHNKGTDVYVETHSDHIQYGLRVLVKQGKLSKEDLDLQFFYKDGSFDTINLSDCGRYTSDLPDGYCDEVEKNLSKLL